MANCIYCGKPAGFLKSVHKECEEKYENGKKEIISSIENFESQKNNLSNLKNKVDDIAKSSFINNKNLKSLIISGWEKAVEKAFENNLLTEEEENSLENIIDLFSLSKEELDKNGSFTKLVQGSVLRDIMEGKIPERMQVQGVLPFNLQKTEKLVWVFQNVDYYEEKTRTRYVGGTRGVSIRVAKGLYFRTGGFRGERVQTSQTVHADTGLLGITNKHIYFAGSIKRFRIKYDKIVTFEPYSDGIGIQKDNATAKPQLFITGDGWFIYNLVTNLAQL